MDKKISTKTIDRNKFIDEMKKKYENSIIENNKGLRTIVFDLGEANIPDGFDDKYISLRVNTETQKHHLVCLLSMGLSEKEKKVRQQKRQELSELIKSLKSKKIEIYKKGEYLDLQQWMKRMQNLKVTDPKFGNR